MALVVIDFDDAGEITKLQDSEENINMLDMKETTIPKTDEVLEIAEIDPDMIDKEDLETSDEEEEEEEEE